MAGKKMTTAEKKKSVVERLRKQRKEAVKKAIAKKSKSDKKPANGRRKKTTSKDLPGNGALKRAGEAIEKRKKAMKKAMGR
jgi:hypothetical protein